MGFQKTIEYNLKKKSVIAEPNQPGSCGNKGESGLLFVVAKMQSRPSTYLSLEAYDTSIEC